MIEAFKEKEEQGRLTKVAQKGVQGGSEVNFLEGSSLYVSGNDSFHDQLHI